MQRLTILYDAHCGFCVRVRQWMSRQPSYIELTFMAADGAAAAAAYPSLRREVAEMIAIDDEGGVYRGTDAYLIILWALQEWRGLALDLAAPAFKGLARRAFAVLSGSRKGLSWIFSLKPEDLVLEEPQRRGV
jgi:predicted DCC family thiol-disulfide oxidoreductase YuxK